MRKQRNESKPAGRVKRTTLIAALAIGFAFSVIIGVTGISMGFGSLYPRLNLVAKPIVCPVGEMSYLRRVSGIGTATYYTAEWICVDETTGATTEIDTNFIYLYAGILYGLLIFVIMLVVTYLYWNSSIGPAKNGGPRLL